MPLTGHFSTTINSERPYSKESCSLQRFVSVPRNEAIASVIALSRLKHGFDSRRGHHPLMDARISPKLAPAAALTPFTGPNSGPNGREKGLEK